MKSMVTATTTNAAAMASLSPLNIMAPFQAP
jgi:hypothetical protein